MNLVLITTGKRDTLLRQSLSSLHENAANWSAHTLTVVCDGQDVDVWGNTKIVNSTPQGASASRNIGASSIPKYRRQKFLMFVDDDIYAAKGWDQKIESVLSFDNKLLCSGYSHPFNLSIGNYSLGPGINVDAAGVLSSVSMAMHWSAFDQIGMWVEPGGAGSSEDVEYCARATKLGYGMAVTRPQVVIHCGLTSSAGQKIVGYDLLHEQNQKLIDFYGLQDKVVIL